MIHISHLTKTAGGKPLLQDVSVTIGSKEHIGLIGRNGSGKSTFLKVLLGTESFDDGSIDKADSHRIVALEQHLAFTKPTIVTQVAMGLPANAKHEDWKAKSVLMGLGFLEADFNRPPADFSSGMQVRLRLAELLVSEAQTLLLDEPTNYLDIVSLRWLEQFLQTWTGAFILVTHDQRFMERVVSHTIGIHRGTMRKLRGGPQKLLDQIKKEEEIHENTRLNTEKKQEKTKEFISKFRAGARSAGLVQSRIKALEKQKKPVKLEKLPVISFAFQYLPFKANTLLEATNCSFGYQESEELFSHFSLKVRAKERIAIIGRNGKGKSTLLRVLVKELQTQSGTIKQHVDLEIGYFAAGNTTNLNPHHSILEELMQLPGVNEKQVRTVCGALLFTGDTVKKPIQYLSGGERSRVCFAKVLLSPMHLLVLDEPTNHLDLESCQVLINALQHFEGTVLFVTHDERMLSSVANRLVVFDHNRIDVYEKTYDEFLAEVGWSEDAHIESQSTNNSSQKDQYEQLKQQRKLLRQVQNQQKKSLVTIESLEAEQIVLGQKLQQAYSDSNRASMEELGKKSHDVANIIADTYEQLERLVAKETEIMTWLEQHETAA